MVTVGTVLRSGWPSSVPELTLAPDFPVPAVPPEANGGAAGSALTRAEADGPAGKGSGASLLSRTADLINRILEDSHRRLKFNVHKDTGRIWVQVVDTETNEVIKEIPPERYLDLVARIWELMGILVDERA